VGYLTIPIFQSPRAQWEIHCLFLTHVAAVCIAMLIFPKQKCLLGKILIVSVAVFFQLGSSTPVQRLPTDLSPNFNELHFLKRSTSSDPSCPEGWLCEQQGCPGNAVCPSGQVCIDFEGTPACAPTGASWCALNQNSLQAVECNGGICWYDKLLNLRFPVLDALQEILQANFNSVMEIATRQMLYAA